jgi:hypothetical protein
MAWTKMNPTVVSSVGILVAMGTTVAVMKAKAQTDRSEDLVAREIQDKSLLPANDNETRRQLQGVGSSLTRDSKATHGSPITQRTIPT